MSSERPPAKPRKTPAYLNIHSSVNKVYRSIRSIKENYLTDEQARDFGIEFSRLDLNNTEMAGSESARYFLPADPAEFNIAATGIKLDEFTGFPSSWIKRLLGRFHCLVGAYLDYGGALWSKYQPSSESIVGAGFKAGERGSIYHDNVVTHLKEAMEYKGDKRSHRVIVLSSTKPADEDRVTVSELEMLVSWMNHNMGAQTLALRNKRLSNRRFHMVFPVLIISFSPPSHARIIQGHYSDSKLHVQFSELFDFDVPNYTNVMNSLLRWTHPIPQGDTVLADEYVAKAPKTRENTSAVIPPTPSSSSTQPKPERLVSNPPSFTLAERPGNIRRTSPAKYQPYDRHHGSNRGRGRGNDDENTRPR